MYRILKTFLIIIATLCLFACQPGALTGGDLTNATGDTGGEDNTASDSPSDTPDETFAAAGPEGTVGSSTRGEDITPLGHEGLGAIAPSPETIASMPNIRILYWAGRRPWDNAIECFRDIDTGEILPELIKLTQAQFVHQDFVSDDTEVEDFFAERVGIVRESDLINALVATQHLTHGYYLFFILRPPNYYFDTYRETFEILAELKYSVGDQYAEFLGDRYIAKPLQKTKGSSDAMRTLWRIDTER